MQDGFVKVAAVAPEVRVADVDHNVGACANAVRTAAEAGAKVIVLPELAITGAACGDLFWQQTLITAAERGVVALASATADVDALVLVGAPVATAGSLYSCAVVLAHGAPIGIVPKTCVGAADAAGDIAGSRQFSAIRPGTVFPVAFAGVRDVAFGTDQLFACDTVPDLVVAVEVGADMVAPVNPATAHAATGATVIAHLGATFELVGSARARRDLARAQSKRLASAYICANAAGESTTDGVCSGHCVVAENGALLAEAVPFGERIALTEIDVAALRGERRRTHMCQDVPERRTGDALRPGAHHVSTFGLQVCPTELTRSIDPLPFVDVSDKTGATTCEGVLATQTAALVARLRHTGTTSVVVGVSGGLDSTLALLVCARAFVSMGLDNTGIVAVTMPGFGTTARTHDNAAELARALGVTLRSVPIAAAVRQHFADIGHDEGIRNAAYENAQARERTQILMDMANDLGALVVGTGDLSELALGWATYNGDHMSMYGVNAGVPKTLVRELVAHAAATTLSAELTRVLTDVLDTPVSPELLPANADGSIAQQTEDLVGPYELHDFFLHQVLRRGASPRKVYRLARAAWGTTYDDATILHWLHTFYRRFFSQQFKRSCMPDGPAVGTVSLSPRGGLVMPSDAVVRLWTSELEGLI